MILSALASEIERHIRRAVKFKDDANGNYGRYLLKTVSVLRGGESSYHLSEAKPENDMLRMIDMYHVGVIELSGRPDFSLKIIPHFLAIHTVLLVGVSLLTMHFKINT